MGQHALQITTTGHQMLNPGSRAILRLPGRTPMDLLAQAAGMSRPALYQYFSGKEDVFRSAGQQLVEEMTEAAECAARTEAPAAQR